MANKNLSAAKEAKNDEFYTQLEDIEAELQHYSDKFQGKVVFCNCDDPSESNFVKFFLMNFNRLGLKELIATGYATSPILGRKVGEKGQPYVLRVTGTSQYLTGTQSELDSRGVDCFLKAGRGFVMQPLIGNPALDENEKPVQVAAKERYIDKKTGKERVRTVKRDLYYEAGDFRSDMCVELLKQADIVCTNPPFSLFREYVAQLMQYQKQFLIIGNKNAITYKEFFPLLKDNQVWLGYTSAMEFMTGEGIVTKHLNGLTKWFTNIDHEKRHQMLPLDLGFTYHGHEDMYPKYDNYDAINVDKTAQIPCDYAGVMGVPISFLDKYCPEQFEILGYTSGRDEFDKSAWPTKRYINAIQHNHDGTTTSGSKANTRPTLLTDNLSGVYYTADNQPHPLTIMYARILIRRKL